MAEKKKTKKESAKPSKAKKIEPVVAKGDDGDIQITLTIPWEQIQKEKEDAIKLLSKSVEVPGFRKGMAPPQKAADYIPQDVLIERILQKILPTLVGEAIAKHNIKPAVYPKFELISAQDEKDWQVVAKTAEIPDVDLGDYKKELRGAMRAGSIWTPDKGKDAQTQEPKQEEKEQIALNILAQSAKVQIPNLLVEEEVSSRLSQLLSRLENLGLNLETYLSSTGKTPQSLREEYEKQSKEALKMELILSKVAELEKITIDEEKIDKAIEDSSGGNEEVKGRLNTPEQRRAIKSILTKQEALQSLTSLIG